jgi:hypothetical protein
MTVTNQNCVHEEIESRLNSGMLSAMQFSLLRSWMLSKIVKINIWKNIILSAALYGCETWSFTLREEHRQGIVWNIWI